MSMNRNKRTFHNIRKLSLSDFPNDIIDPLLYRGRTKAYKYLFIPGLLFWHDALKRAFTSMDIENVYIGIHDSTKPLPTIAEFAEQNPTLILHIVININNNYYRHIDTITQYSFYKGSYMLDDKRAVILFKHLSKASINPFLQSEYSKMYDEDDLEIECKNSFMETEEYRYIFRVLTKDENTIDEFIKLYPAIKKEEIRELDSALSLTDELLHE